MIMIVKRAWLRSLVWIGSVFPFLRKKKHKERQSAMPAEGILIMIMLGIPLAIIFLPFCIVYTIICFVLEQLGLIKKEDY